MSRGQVRWRWIPRQVPRQVMRQEEVSSWGRSWMHQSLQREQAGASSESGAQRQPLATRYLLGYPAPPDLFRRPLATELVAPPEGNRFGKSQISGSEGAGRAADAGLRTHSPRGGILRLREHLAEAFSPPSQPCSRPTTVPPEPFLPLLGSSISLKKMRLLI